MDGGRRPARAAGSVMRARELLVLAMGLADAQHDITDELQSYKNFNFRTKFLEIRPITSQICSLPTVQIVSATTAKTICANRIYHQDRKNTKF